MSAAGIVDLASVGSVLETADRLEGLLRAKGLKIFARIDQTAEARAFGLSLRPTVLLIFGDPRSGTPLMERYPSLALDLPLKALVWESADGKVWLSYNTPEFLQHRHGMEAPPFTALAPLLRLATQSPHSDDKA
jgi:uncharacterized protein (DUF302 family)